MNPLSPAFSSDHLEIGKDSTAEEVAVDKTIADGKPKGKNYVSHSAIALRCRVMPPPCIRNPYLKDVSEKEKDPFGNQRSKCAGIVWVSSFMSHFKPLWKKLLQPACYYICGVFVYSCCNFQSA